MAKAAVFLTIMTVMCFDTPKTAASIIYDDGGVHQINSIIDDDVWIYANSTGNPTTVNLTSSGNIQGRLLIHDNSLFTMSGGSIGLSLHADDNSQTAISGGSIEQYLVTFQNSHLAISDGLIDTVYGDDNSYVTISGGSINYLYAAGDSQVTLSGGSIAETLYVIDNGEITIYGTDFSIDGVTVGYTELTHTSVADYTMGTLTGTLASGETINNNFRIYQDATIVIVPEPATVFLLGLGCLALRSRMSTRSITRKRQCYWLSVLFE